MIKCSIHELTIQLKILIAQQLNFKLSRQEFLVNKKLVLHNLPMIKNKKKDRLWKKNNKVKFHVFHKENILSINLNILNLKITVKVTVVFMNKIIRTRRKSKLIYITKLIWKILWKRQEFLMKKEENLLNSFEATNRKLSHQKVLENKLIIWKSQWSNKTKHLTQMKCWESMVWRRSQIY